MSLANPEHLVIALPADQPLDTARLTAELCGHVTATYTLQPAFPLRPHRRRWRSSSAPAVLVAEQHPDGTVWAAAGPLHHLDLPRLTREACAAARARWHVWHRLIAAATPRARDWASYRAQPIRGARRLPRAEARRRFEAQPRVLTMLAVNAQGTLPFALDIDELDAFQAGETVYATLAWQQALLGQALVLPGGVAYRPISINLADRLRYLRAALDAVHTLPAGHHLAALSRIG